MYEDLDDIELDKEQNVMNKTLLIVSIVVILLTIGALGGGYYFIKVLQVPDKNALKFTDELLEKAKAGDAKAQNEVGLCYLNGYGTIPKLESALEWFRKSAAQEYGPAQYQLAHCYANGIGVEKDSVASFNWVKRAAESGYPDAQYNMGIFYLNGAKFKNMEIKPDVDKAIDLFTKAAEQDFDNAQSLLATFYQNGHFVEKNDKEAFKWLLKLAEKGDIQAQTSVALMYLDGIGVEKDLEESKKWKKLVEDKGVKIDVSQVTNYVDSVHIDFMGEMTKKRTPEKGVVK